MCPWSAKTIMSRSPVIRILDPAGEHGTIMLQPLAGNDEPELIEMTERAQVKSHEGSVRRVEVFPMGA